MIFIIGMLSIITPAMAATRTAADYVQPNTYNNAYPYMSNTMRNKLDPGINPNRATPQINVLARTKNQPAKNTATTPQRTVVARSASNGGGRVIRSATPANTKPAMARSATNQRMAPAATGTTQRTVVSRAAAYGRNSAARSATTPITNQRTYTNRAATTTAATTGKVSVSSARCLADYTECMNNYCLRENTAYNRCYCSPKLAQIDAKYKDDINDLINQIIKLQNSKETTWTNDEMREYWQETVGKYTGTNSWSNLESALDIDWASMESRVRGQQAFTAGHDYCVQHLGNCFSMSSNLRDAYRSEITRDCNAYETSLQRLKATAESVIEAYK